MATGNAAKTYGVGPGAEKLNVGPATGTNSKLNADGTVTDKDGEVVFDPKDDAVELKQADPDIDYVAGVGLPSDGN